MKKAAITKAAERLEKAKEALDFIKQSRRYEEFAPAWANFLASIKGVHSIFEASAHPKKSPKAHGWYTRKIRERRTDPLLKYLNAARNADEYGVEPIIRHDPGGLSVGAPGEAVHIEYMGPSRDGRSHRELVLRAVNGKFPTVRNHEPTARLVTVNDERFNDSFDPPEEHLGKRLESGSIVEVATLAIEYHVALIEQAREYVDGQ